MHVHVFYKALSFSRSVSTPSLRDADVPSCSFKSFCFLAVCFWTLAICVLLLRASWNVFQISKRTGGFKLTREENTGGKKLGFGIWKAILSLFCFLKFESTSGCLWKLAVQLSSCCRDQDGLTSDGNAVVSFHLLAAKDSKGKSPGMLLGMSIVFLFEEQQLSCLHNKSWRGAKYSCVVWGQSV